VVLEAARRKVGAELRKASVTNELAAKLAAELQTESEFGQPFIYEKEYRIGKLRVTVVWDEWDDMPLSDRSATIGRAYEVAGAVEYRNRVALASGLTVPEAHAAGMLPYEILPAVRRGDPMTLEEALKAMVDEGGTGIQPSGTFLDRASNVQLRFATLEEAEANKQRLIRRFPGSDEVWVIHRDMTTPDFAATHESADSHAE
jgi:hypothetical protein